MAKSEAVTMDGKQTKAKKDKNKKILKRISKQITRLEKVVTQIHQLSQKLQILKAVTEKKAA